MIRKCHTPRHRRRLRRLAAAVCLLAAASGCAAPRPRPGDELLRRCDEIVVCGRLFHTGTRVVLWTDPGGFDAYRVHRRFTNRDEIAPSRPAAGCDTPHRYTPLRGGLSDEVAGRVQENGWTLHDLQTVVDQFVIHYDVCGSSRRCFEVLHDIRGLSVHFLLDVDGTIYQTLDLKERARHAGQANDRSIGVEIAHMGAYADPSALDEWYERDERGVRLRPVGSAVRTVDTHRTDDPGSARSAQRTLQMNNHGADGRRIFRPARGELIFGRINGTRLYQYDFTPEQYDALAHLTATLVRVLPGIRLDIPRDHRPVQLWHDAVPGKQLFEFARTLSMADLFAPGVRPVRRDVLPEEALAGYRGLLGHYHVTRQKSDPGPAFDWERLLGDVRELLNDARGQSEWTKRTEASVVWMR